MHVETVVEFSDEVVGASKRWEDVGETYYYSLDDSNNAAWMRSETIAGNLVLVRVEEECASIPLANRSDD